MKNLEFADVVDAYEDCDLVPPRYCKFQAQQQTAQGRSLSPSLFYRRLRFSSSSSSALRKQTLATLPPTGSLSRSLRLCTLSYVSSRLVPLFPNWFTCSVWSRGPTSQFGLETSNPPYFSIGEKSLIK
jgi:hypothetical protein